MANTKLDHVKNVLKDIQKIGAVEIVFSRMKNVSRGQKVRLNTSYKSRIRKV